MSLHSQLLRGLLALPVMLLLAIAGVIAPGAAPSPSSLPAPELAEVAARGEGPVMVDTALRASCPKRVVRVQFAGR
jgi:hypothetical protein